MVVLRNGPRSTLVFVAGSHPAAKGWKKSGFYRNMPYTAENPTIPQLKARIAFGEFMLSQFGKKGTVTLPDGRVISVPAFEAMTNYPYKGIGAFGGLSPEERARRRHEMARANLEKLKALLQAKAGAVM